MIQTEIIISMILVTVIFDIYQMSKYNINNANNEEEYNIWFNIHYFTITRDGYRIIIYAILILFIFALNKGDI